MEEMTQLREVGGRRGEHTQPSYPPCRLWLFTQGCLPKPRAREKEAGFEAGKLRRRKNSGPGIWAKVYLYPRCVVREVAVNGAPSEVSSCCWSAACSGCLLRIAGLCHCRSDVCTWVLATLWGQCVTTPGPTEALLQARLSFPMTAVSGATAALLLYWSILTFNLRWDFKLYLPTSPPFYLFCTNTSFSDKIDKEKYAKKIKIAHLDKHNCRKYTI